MSNKIKPAVVLVVLIVGFSLYFNSGSDVAPNGQKNLTSDEMKQRALDYAQKAKAAADAKAAGQPAPASPAPNAAKASAIDAPILPSSSQSSAPPPAPPEEKPVVPVAVAPAAPPSPNIPVPIVIETKPTFHAGPRSFYLQVSGGAVLWLKLSSTLTDADGDAVATYLKSACFGDGKECPAQVEVEPSLLEQVKTCATLGAGSEAQMVGSERLQAKYFLSCPATGRCWTEPSGKFALSAKELTDSGDAVAQLEALILPSGGCNSKSPRAPASSTGFVVEKLMQTSKYVAP